MTRRRHVPGWRLPKIGGEVPPQGWIVTLVPRPWLPALSLLMGVAILFGGTPRFSGASFVAIRSLAPWWVWSVAFAALGAAQLIPMKPCHEWWVRFAAAIPYVLFAVGLLWATATGPTTATTGIAVYGWIAAVHLRMAALKRVEAKLRKAKT